MTIFLTILKVIGIVLLAVLGIILALVLMILFVPVRYRVTANLQEEKRAKARISWLLHLVNVVLDYRENQVVAYLRILFFKKALWRYPQEEEPDSDEEEGRRDKKNSGAKEEQKAEKISEAEEETPDTLSEEDEELRKILHRIDESKVAQGGLSAEMENTDLPQQTVASERTSDSGDMNVAGMDSANLRKNESEDEKKHGYNPVAWIRSVIRKIKDTISKIREMLQNIHKTAERLTREVSDEHNQDAVRHLKDEVFYFLKVLTPKRFKMDLEYSTGSPDTTGQMLGILALFPTGYTNRWRICPDFASEQFYVKGVIDAKGRIFVVQLLAMAIRIVKDRNCRRLYHRMQK